MKTEKQGFSQYDNECTKRIVGPGFYKVYFSIKSKQ